MTTKELCAALGISKERARQLREGTTVKRGGKSYESKAQLIENEDWHWNGGRVVFHESALEKRLKTAEQRKERKNAKQS